jgi:hypothetical protein
MRPRVHSIKPHGMRLVLSNGQTYTPDFIAMASENDAFTAYETKAMWGKTVHVEAASASKIKTAAMLWPSITFVLAWFDKSKHAWQFQTVRP